MFWYQFLVGFFGTVMFLFGYKTLKEIVSKQLVDKLTMTYFYVFVISAAMFAISAIIFILKTGVVIQ